jgi:hypothetical protein
VKLLAAHTQPHQSRLLSDVKRVSWYHLGPIGRLSIVRVSIRLSFCIIIEEVITLHRHWKAAELPLSTWRSIACAVCRPWLVSALQHIPAWGDAELRQARGTGYVLCCRSVQNVSLTGHSFIPLLADNIMSIGLSMFYARMICVFLYTKPPTNNG